MLRVVFVIATVLLASASAAEPLPPAGAMSCSGCHADDGTNVPALQDSSPDDIVTSMLAFRDGTLEATVMDRIAKGFSDNEIRAIAEWISAQQQETK